MFGFTKYVLVEQAIRDTGSYELEKIVSQINQIMHIKMSKWKDYQKRPDSGKKERIQNKLKRYGLHTSSDIQQVINEISAGKNCGRDKYPRCRDLKGDIFGKLTCIEIVGKGKNNVALWRCRCDCGNEVVIGARSLTKGERKSCGCLRTKHGLRETDLYEVWKSMRSRCFSKSNASYERYGARGITICDDWMEFKPFYDWAMSNGYKNGLTIERIDNDGNYEPSNCKWATYAEQALNRSSNNLISYKGMVQTIKEWADLYNINYGTLRSRICRYKWSIKRALETPVK